MLSGFRLIAIAIALTCIGAAPASAATIIDNPINGVDGNCAFATACGATEGATDPSDRAAIGAMPARRGAARST